MLGIKLLDKICNDDIRRKKIINNKNCTKKNQIFEIAIGRAE